MSYTICPNEILNDSSIDGNAYRIWMMIAQYDNLDGWRHILKAIASKVGLCADTVRAKVRLLIAKKYLIRTEKNNGEFGYNYSLPDKYKPKNFTHRDEKTRSGKTAIGNSTDGKNSCNNNTELNNTKDQIKIESNQKIENDFNFDSSQNKEVAQDDRVGTLDQKQTLDNEPERSSQDTISAAEILDNPDFLAYAQKQLPKAKNIKAYLRSIDKKTNKPIYAKIARMYATKDIDLDNYWQGKELHELEFDKIHPDYDRWLELALRTKLEWKFAEDQSLGYSRNLRIIFYRWVKTQNTHTI